MTTPESLRDALTAIHATPHLGVIRFAGAGAQALAWLHSVGGSSRTLLEATDHYAAASLVQAVGFEPERFASERVASALAEGAYRRAKELSRASVFGLGCAATIATDRPKRGEHRAFIAVRDPFGVTSYSLELTKGERTRQGEEDEVSRLIVRAVAEACGLRDLPRSEEHVEHRFEPDESLKMLRSGEVAWVKLEPGGSLRAAEEGETLPRTALLSGSFNPLHKGHRALADAAAEHLGREVYFELPLVNADKASIDLLEARRRAAQFADHALLLLTRAPLFQQKADLFPDSVFVIGVDTAARLVQPRFYEGEAGMDAALTHLEKFGCRFLVAGRQSQEKGDGRFLTLGDIDLPQEYRNLFEALPEEVFRQDISSSELRASR